jgi:hypothetical protein
MKLFKKNKFFLLVTSPVLTSYISASALITFRSIIKFLALAAGPISKWFLNNSHIIFKVFITSILLIFSLKFKLNGLNFTILSDIVRTNNNLLDNLFIIIFLVFLSNFIFIVIFFKPMFLNVISKLNLEFVFKGI